MHSLSPDTRPVRRAYTTLRRTVWAHYRKHGRHDLPWRNTQNPYNILVSEIMLQQTQVERVTAYYRAFLKKFPTIESLARAPLRDVLLLWQGLGYNRRAKMLHDTAKMVTTQHGGRMPKEEEALRELPGIGPYTAGAVCAFAYNMPTVILETNIRTVLLHKLLPTRTHVPDSELFMLAQELIDTKRPREWYWALMDYGSYLKRHGVRVNTHSKHYTHQKPFRGSLREVRGAVIKTLSHGAGHTERALTKTLAFPRENIQRSLASLMRDGLVQKRGRRWAVS